MKTETQGPALAMAAVPSGVDSIKPITPKMSPIKWDGVEGELEVAELHLPVKSDIEDNDNETRETVESNVETVKEIVYVVADETDETFDTHNQPKGATTSEGTKSKPKLPRASRYANLPEAKGKPRGRSGGRPKGSITRKRVGEEDHTRHPDGHPVVVVVEQDTLTFTIDDSAPQPQPTPPKVRKTRVAQKTKATSGKRAGTSKKRKSNYVPTGKPRGRPKRAPGSEKAKYTKGKMTKHKAQRPQLVPYSGQMGEEVTGGHGSDANQMDINGNEEELVQPNASYKVVKPLFTQSYIVKRPFAINGEPKQEYVCHAVYPSGQNPWLQGGK